jgi:hypothetical protein
MLDLMPPGSISLAPGFEWACVQHPMEYGPETLEITRSASA